MNTIKLYNEYLRIAEEQVPELEKEFEQIVSYMKNSTAIHHGEYVRTCYIPKLFTKKDFEFITADIEILYGIFDKIIHEYYKSPDYRRLFGFDAVTETLILRSNPELSLLPMARIDFFFNDETKEYKFCEFNTDGTSAMNEDRELNLAQKSSTAYRLFKEAYPCKTCELFDTWIETVLTLYNKNHPQMQALEVSSTSRKNQVTIENTENKTKSVQCHHAMPYVAIADYMEFGTVSEFEIFRNHFIAKGIEAEVCDIRSFHYDKEKKELLSPLGRRVDVIYRRAVTSDILSHMSESEDFLLAVKDGAVLLLGDFHTQLIHNKMIFCILQAEETFRFLTKEEQDFIRRHVPVTMLFSKKDIETFDLFNTKDKWILKPLDSYGSKGIHAGCESDQETWKEIVRHTSEEGYILQEFYTPYITLNYGYKDGHFGKYEYYNLTGIYTYDGIPQGVYSRVSLTPIISSQYSEKTLPTLIVDA